MSFAAASSAYFASSVSYPHRCRCTISPSLYRAADENSRLTSRWPKASKSTSAGTETQPGRQSGALASPLGAAARSDGVRSGGHVAWKRAASTRGCR